MVDHNLPPWSLGPFIRPEGVNPIISPNLTSSFYCPMRKTSIKWEALHTFNPTAIVKDQKVYLFYRAEDDTGEMKIGHHTSRLGLAESNDGIHFTRKPEPVFYPMEDNQKKAEWTGGCEDPRIIEAENGIYVLTYTQYNRMNPRLAIATSTDLIHWKKYGGAFYKFGIPWGNFARKSGAIVTELQNGRLKAVKINGKYWMYWGERGLNLASSSDLIQWENQGMVIQPREGFFDSQLTEGGPPAILTKEGILVIYNGKNHGSKGDSQIKPHTYAGGQVLFDKTDPKKVLERLNIPFFKPELSFEKSGQYTAGTTFLEGLVYFQDKWFLYYGCADSFVGVAICEKKI